MPPCKKNKDTTDPYIGRYVSHVRAACEPCRRMKIRCSGKQPCEGCEKRGKGEGCFFTERGPRGFTPRGLVKQEIIAVDTSEGNESASISGKGSCPKTKADLRSQPTDECSTVAGDYSNTSISTTSNSSSNSSSKETQSNIVAEKLLGDEATGRFLMNVFVRKVHPHMFSVISASPSNLFETVLNSIMKPSDAIQRDAGLAMACRTCGHFQLGKMLVERMVNSYEKIKDEPLSSESYSAIALLGTILFTENVTKGVEVSKWALAMHSMLFPNSDPISAICEFLDALSLESNTSGTKLKGYQLSNFIGCNEFNGMYNDWASVTKEEITAHVQMATAQLLNWSQTMEDPQFRNFVCLTIHMLAKVAVPSMRAPFVMQMALFVDLHLLGSLVPPYITEILERHNPDKQFSMPLLFTSCAGFEDSLDACPISEEIASALLRRILVTRMLQFTCGVNMDVMSSFLTMLEVLELTVQWRSGNREKAELIGRWILQFVERHDTNFWSPRISQYLMILGCIFFEMRDVLGMVRTISILAKLQRSQPSVKIGIEVLKELQMRMVELGEEGGGEGRR